MPRRELVLPEEQHFILSTVSPSATHKWLAAGVVVGISMLFALISAGPLKDVQPGRVIAFVPIYATAMFVCDSITALLLYAQFSIVRSRATLVIASGYLFMALMLIRWTLVFPGFLAPAGLMGGLQSTSWVYFLQHAGFSLFVIGYVLSRQGSAQAARRWKGSTAHHCECRRNVLATVVVAAYVCIAKEALLPKVVLDTVVSLAAAELAIVGVPVALLSLVAVGRRTLEPATHRSGSVADGGHVAVAVEMPLSFYPDPERFSISWYMLRVFGILADTIILLVLLHEITTLYARLLGAVHARAPGAGSPTADRRRGRRLDCYEVRQPLTAMVTTADAGLRFLDNAAAPFNIDRARKLSATSQQTGIALAPSSAALTRTSRVTPQTRPVLTSTN